MSNIAAYAMGWKFRVGRFHLRVWKNGFEYGNGKSGRIRWFPWYKPGRVFTQEGLNSELNKAMGFSDEVNWKEPKDE